MRESGSLGRCWRTGSRRERTAIHLRVRTVLSRPVCASQLSSRFEPAVGRVHSIVCSQDTLVENVEVVEGLPHRFLPKRRTDRGWYSSLVSFV